MEEFGIPFKEIVKKEMLVQISEEEFVFPGIIYNYNVYGALQTIGKVYNKKEDKSYHRVYTEQTLNTRDGHFESQECPDLLIVYRKSRMVNEPMEFDINAL